MTPYEGNSHCSEESKHSTPLSLADDVQSVTGAVKMVRFSYSNEDTKDEEGRESWRPEMPLSRCYAPSPPPHASPPGGSMVMPQHLEHRWDMYHLCSIGPVAQRTATLNRNATKLGCSVTHGIVMAEFLRFFYSQKYKIRCGESKVETIVT